MPEEAPVPGQDQPVLDSPEAPQGADQPPESPESFTDFDPSQVPEFKDAAEAREWVGNRVSQFQRDYTQKTQAISEVQREAEQQAALIDGLRDPSTMPHYLRLMGIDFSDPQTLELLGISGAGESTPEGYDDLLDDPNDVETRVERIEREREEEVQQNEAAAMEDALDQLADQNLETIEQEWGRELDPEEDAFIRHHAESSPGPDGLPDYESAAALLKGWLGRREQQFAQQRSEPGRGAPGGRPGGKALDPNKEEDRMALAAAAAERAMASQNN